MTLLQPVSHVSSIKSHIEAAKLCLVYSRKCTLVRSCSTLDAGDADDTTPAKRVTRVRLVERHADRGPSSIPMAIWGIVTYNLQKTAQGKGKSGS